MEKIEKSIIKIKEKIGEHTLAIIYFGIFSIVAIIAMMELKMYKVQKQKIQNSYNRAFYDLVADMNNIDAEFTKLKVTSSDKYTITALATIFAKANNAVGNLDIIPFSNNTTSNVSKFLNQLSDFSYYLMRDILNGEKVDTYKAQIDVLYTNVGELSKILNEVYQEVNENKINWDELEKVGNEKIKESDVGQEISSVNKIGKTFTEYEGIIYDGAFSNHVLTQEPNFLVGEDLAPDEVENILRQKLDISQIEFLAEQNSTIPLYVYRLVTKNSELEKTLYATKQDGRIFQIVSNRKVEERNLTVDGAKNIAGNFLNSLGIGKLEATYYLVQDNTVTISYAGLQDDILIYSDLIKIKIALDNGEILGLETNGYIYNHKERIIEYKYSIDDAREVLYEKLNVVNERMCIIPTESKSEKIAYEFEGYIDDTKFLVYINADTLEEEKIYIVLESDNGIKTM